MTFNFSRSFSTRAGAEPLSDDTIRTLAPSAFAAEAHESRSARYAYIPTSAVIEGMRAEGFLPVFAKQARCRDAGRQEHTKHMVRFRRQGVSPARRVGDSFPEIVLINSHDGSSSYHLMSGVFRLVCLNGMVVADRRGAEVRVPHKGDVVRQVIEGSHVVLDESQRALEAADAWAGVPLGRDEQAALAEAAHVLRFGDAAGEADTPIRPAQLLEARRSSDRSDDLWTVFNRVQENTIRGGLSAWGRDPNGRPRRVTSREVTGIDQDVRLNQALWLLGERMATLKGAA